MTWNSKISSWLKKYFLSWSEVQTMKNPASPWNCFAQGCLLKQRKYMLLMWSYIWLIIADKATPFADWYSDHFIKEYQSSSANLKKYCDYQIWQLYDRSKPLPPVFAMFSLSSPIEDFSSKDKGDESRSCLHETELILSY